MDLLGPSLFLVKRSPYFGSPLREVLLFSSSIPIFFFNSFIVTLKRLKSQLLYLICIFLGLLFVSFCNTVSPILSSTIKISVMLQDRFQVMLV